MRPPGLIHGDLPRLEIYYNSIYSIDGIWIVPTSSLLTVVDYTNKHETRSIVGRVHSSAAQQSTATQQQQAAEREASSSTAVVARGSCWPKCSAVCWWRLMMEECYRPALRAHTRPLSAGKWPLVYTILEPRHLLAHNTARSTVRSGAQYKKKMIPNRTEQKTTKINYCLYFSFEIIFFRFITFFSHPHGKSIYKKKKNVRGTKREDEKTPLEDKHTRLHAGAWSAASQPHPACVVSTASTQPTLGRKSRA